MFSLPPPFPLKNTLAGRNWFALYQSWGFPENKKQKHLIRNVWLKYFFETISKEKRKISYGGVSFLFFPQ